MLDAKSNRPGSATGAATESWRARIKHTAQTEDSTVSARLRAADDTIRQAWEALMSGRIRLDELYAASPHAAALYWAGYSNGLTSADERVRQAEHTVDRLHLRVYEPERAAEIERRLDVALEAMPDDVEPHSAEYFERALSGVLVGGAA